MFINNSLKFILIKPNYIKLCQIKATKRKQKKSIFSYEVIFNRLFPRFLSN